MNTDMEVDKEAAFYGWAQKRGIAGQAYSALRDAFMDGYAAARAQPVAAIPEATGKPRDFLKWWTSIETDTRKSLLVGAHRNRDRLHALLRMAYEADSLPAIPEAQPVEGCKTDFNKGWSLGFNACRDIVMAASAGGNNLPAIPEARGLTHAADYIDRQAESYMQENARADYDTGAAEWRNDECRDHYYAMSELADEIRNLTPASLPAIPEAGQSVPEVCTWTLSDWEFSTWKSSCGEMWSFIDGGPKENRVSFCHHCGKPAHIASMSADASPQKKEST